MRKVNRALIQIVHPEATFDDEIKRLTKAQKLKQLSNKDDKKKSSKKDTEVEVDQEELDLDRLHERILQEEALAKDPDWLPGNKYAHVPKRNIGKPTLHPTMQGQGTEDVIHKDDIDEDEDMEENFYDASSDVEDEASMRGDDVPLPDDDDDWPPTPERPTSHAQKRKLQSEEDDVFQGRPKLSERDSKQVQPKAGTSKEIPDDVVDDNDDNQLDNSMDTLNQLAGHKRRGVPVNKRNLNVKVPARRGTKREKEEGSSPPASPPTTKKTKQSTPPVLRRSKRIQNLPEVVYDETEMDIYCISNGNPEWLRRRLEELRRRYVQLYGHEPRHKWFLDAEEKTWRKILSCRR